MKLFSTILVTYILLLTAVPSMTAQYSFNRTEHCEKSCCHSKKAKKQHSPMSQQHKDKGCCSNGICNNPFMNCCTIFALTTNFRVLPSLTHADQQFNALTANPNAAFLADAWRPPKTV